MQKDTKKNWDKVSMNQMGHNWQVFLDHKPLKSPHGEILNLDFELAKKVFKEWQNIDDKLSAVEMPYYSFVVTTIDRIIPQKHFVIDKLVSILNKDLVCYWENNNNELKNIHSKQWKPIINWFEKKFEVKLILSKGIIPINQSQTSLVKIKTLIQQFDNYYISGLHELASLSGSLVLTLALFYEKISLNEFYKKSFIDEFYQSKKWGEDKEAIERRENIFTQFKQAFKFIKLIKKINS